jgi:hypothetical protein
MPENANKLFDRNKQLLQLIKGFPKYSVDIHGVVLDYIAKTDEKLHSIFEYSPSPYKHLFLAKDKEPAKALLKSVIQNDQRTRDDLIEKCTDIFPKVSALIREMIAEEEIKPVVAPVLQRPLLTPE